MEETTYYSIREVAKKYGVAWRTVKYHIEREHIKTETIEGDPIVVVPEDQMIELEKWIRKSS